MKPKIIQIDWEVAVELLRRTQPGSYNHRLRQIFGMPPPQPLGRPKGAKNKKARRVLAAV